ncbi:MAG: redox-regulated ATPase YchF [Candidatus Pacebacteria bacterium]|nr:redox-regulated ATPase YchF [Candidatus Paceibacterota bacterium]
MSLSLAIVGLPNVGKSSLFNLLTKTQVEASNYPFCTIDPNVGVVAVPDKRLDLLSEMSKSKKTIATSIEFVDVAGLVKGAHKGEGLGNQFLANIRECDAICEVIRGFKNDNIVHVAGKIDPRDDKETIDLELIFADTSTVTKRLEKSEKEVKSGDKEAIFLRETLQKIKTELESGVPVRNIDLEEKEKKALKPLNLLTAKPIIYLINGEEKDFNSEHLKFLHSENTLFINVKLEQEIMSLNEEERQEYLEELGLKQSGLDKLISASYKLLDLDTFFTTGPEETRAWTIKSGSLAPVAGSAIHTDFEKLFIRVEVINWEKLLQAGSFNKAKEQGLIRIEGKNYIVKDGDVCVFLINK